MASARNEAPREVDMGMGVPTGGGVYVGAMSLPRIFCRLLS